MNDDYLEKRVEQISRLATGMVQAGVQGVILPAGGHAVYIDMNKFFTGTEMKIGDFGGVGFVIELIRLYGIRCCESGPFMFEWDQKSDEQRAGILNLVRCTIGFHKQFNFFRFAIPRNMYAEEHINYTISAVADLYKHREMIPKVCFLKHLVFTLPRYSSHEGQS